MPDNRAVLLALTLVLCPIGTVRGQGAGSVDEARRRIEALDIEGAEGELRRFFADNGRRATSEVARAHVLMGIAKALQSQPESARGEFREALWIDPSLRIDSLTHLGFTVSALFTEERAKWRSAVKVVSDPAGAMVRVDGRVLGPAPLERRVPSEAVIEIAASTSPRCATQQGMCSAQASASVRFAVPSQRRAIVELAVPADTIPWTVPSRAQLRMVFEQSTEYAGFTPADAPEIRSRRTGHGAAMTWTIVKWTLGLAAVGAAIGNVMPIPEYPPGYLYDPARKADRGNNIALGTTIGFLGGLLAGAARNGTLQTRSTKAREAYVREAREALTAERVESLWRDASQSVAAIIRRNESIRAGNARLPQPRISVEMFPEP